MKLPLFFFVPLLSIVHSIPRPSSLLPFLSLNTPHLFASRCSAPSIFFVLVGRQFLLESVWEKAEKDIPLGGLLKGRDFVFDTVRAVDKELFLSL